MTGGCLMRRAMTVLALVLSGSLSAQSVSDTIIQRERAKLQAEHTGEGFGALYLPTYEGVNQGGQVRTLGPGSTYQTSADPKFVLEEPLTVQVYQSAAVVTGIQAPGGARRVRFVRLWVREGRDWKIAIHHGTTIAQTQANATPVAPAGRTATPLPALSGEEAAVFSVQKALSEAYARHDATTYERWTAPEFVTVTTSGQVIPRDQWLKNNIIENQEKRVPSVNDDVKVQIFGDVAVITFRNLAQLPDGTVAPPERVTTVLARKNGAWQQVLTQSTPIRVASTAN
jgi:ketosteroid isomerase-like protein